MKIISKITLFLKIEKKGNKVEWAEILFIIGVITLPIAGIILALTVFDNPTILSQIKLD